MATNGQPKYGSFFLYLKKFSSFSLAINNHLEKFSQETKLRKRFVSVNRRKRNQIIGYRSIFYLFYIDHKTQKLVLRQNEAWHNVYVT